jgi:hypothetical protein
MKLWQGLLVAVATLVAVAGIACSGETAGDTAGPGYVAASDKLVGQISPDQASGQDTAAQSPRVARLLDGFPLWIENGSSIPLGSARVAEVWVMPYPPAREGVLDLTLRNPDDGASIVNARVEMAAHMRYMDHGVFRAAGVERTGVETPGQYRVPLRLAMPGEWVVTVRVDTGALTEEFDLLVAVNQ